MADLPIVLALDSSSGQCSVALAGGVTAQLSEAAARSHSQRLLPMVTELLAQASVQLSDVSVIAFAMGPGSFTGVRIATATAQGLAFALQKPIAPISTLAALAYQGTRLGHSRVLPLLDARMGQCYWGLYQACAQRGVVPLLPDQLNHPADVQGQAELMIGEGEHLPALMPADVARIPFCPQVPEAWAVAQLALLQPDGWLSDPALAQPQYLRDQVVQLP